ncbi:hypothetical protein BJF78_24605 [Pseudonocardia sp. CNS-139]|nr:hypothetical protein BJF78_24605 [Pseudonocardia sp. CNS-139]
MGFTVRSKTSYGVDVAAFVDGSDQEARDTAVRIARYDEKYNTDVTVTGPDGETVDHRGGAA